jgi:hypothetical protein
LESQSCGAAASVGAKKPRPVVIASSATTAFSGKSAPIDAPSAPVVIAPEPRKGRSRLTTGAGICRALTASHSISSAAIWSSSGRARTWPWQSSG